MRTVLLLWLMTWSAICFAQQGSTSLKKLGNPDGKTWAVIIGISDYQDPAIPDLRFAHKDAEAFATYLRSPAGGNLPEASIRLLTNEKATMGAVAAELDWLVEVSQPGDRAIIYFSGHGDVEAKTARQPGFLLTYDSPPKIYIAGAYPLFYLQLIIETLSNDKNVQTIVITDACRSGKLAGSEIGGTQATAANLAKQYANEIKILSCQSNEFSLEGEQWGGGRGAFSFHLIEGLIGLADKNDSGDVNLLELENYLETVVPEEAAPHSQIPITIGSKGTLLAHVDDDILAMLKDLKGRQLPTLAAIESKGFEVVALANADTAIQNMYDAFITALGQKNLLDDERGKPSADNLYRQLMQEESLASLHSFMTRQFATALQDDAQQAINAYLLANPTELEKRWKGDSTYNQYPRYLGRAAELLGESHYMHDFLIAKQLYFEGLNLRLQLDQGSMVGNYHDAIKKQEAALALEDRAAFFYNELGVLHTRLKLSLKAVAYYKKAIELAPEWGLPYVNYCAEAFYSGNKKEAIEYGEKALKLMPNYPQLLNFLGWIYADRLEDGDRSNYRRGGVELKDDFIYRPNNLLSSSEAKIYYLKTIELLEKAVAIDSNYTSGQVNLGFCYIQSKNFEKALKHLKKAVELDSTWEFTHGRLADAYKSQGNYIEAEKAYKKALSLVDSNSFNAGLWYHNAGAMYVAMGKDKEALEYALKAVANRQSYGYLTAATIYAKQGNFEKAEWCRLKSLSWMNYNSFAINQAANTYAQMNRYKDAEWMYLKALDLYPDFTQAKISLVKNYLKTGDYAKASELMLGLITKDPDNPLIHFIAGQHAYKNKQYEAAENYFKQTIAHATTAVDSATYLNNIGWIYKNHEKYQLAGQYLQQGINGSHKLYHPYINLSEISRLTGNHLKALEIAKQGLSVFPDNKELQERVIFCSYLAESPEAAKQIFEAAAQSEPAYRDVWDFFEYIRLKKYDKAVDSWQLFDGKFGTRTQYLVSMYLGALTQMGNLDAAVKLLAKTEWEHLPYTMLTTDPLLAPLRQRAEYQQYLRSHFPENFDDLDTFNFSEYEGDYFLVNCEMLADFYTWQGEHERAKFLYEKALSLEPDSLTFDQAYSLGNASKQLHQFEKATAFYQKALEVQSNKAEVWYSLAEVTYSHKQFEAADSLFQKSIDLDNSYLNPVGYFYINHGDFQLGEQYLMQSIQNPSSKNIGAFAFLYELYLSDGKYQEALEIINQGLIRVPNDPILEDLKIIATYFASEPAEAKIIFEDAAMINPAFLNAWDFFESMRMEEYTKAAALWKTFEKSITSWNLVHWYIGALTRSGNMEAALKLLDRTNISALNYHRLTTDPLLEPLRREPAYQEYMLKNFPEKVKG